MADRTELRQIKRRDGSVVDFDRRKIERAIQKAAYAVLREDLKSIRIGSSVTDAVIRKTASAFKNRIPTVEDVQDIVEAALMEEGYSHIAKAYILYREKRSEVRLVKSALGLKDDLKLPLNTIEVLRRRYLLKNDERNIIETPSELFRRVASHIAQGEKNFKSSVTPEEVEERYYHMMRSLEFIPNSPTLMNAGTLLGQLSACFVIPVEDSIGGIFEALRDMARIHQTGGGTGFSFSRLRPQGDLVASTKGEASGPVSFMEIFDKATGVILQGGRRRGANMGILRCDHPDILDFVEAKLGKDRLSNFNISVGATDKFMDAVIHGKSYDLINPRNDKKTGSVKARSVFDLIVNAAWHTGDPGLIFLDEINRKNPTPGVGKIEATNPCGELPLLPYESCNLASINLAKMVKGREVDWEKLKEQIAWGIRFLDDVIEVNKFPLPQIREITFANRKIGLGGMGFADMLIQLGIPYNSPEAILFAERLMRFIRTESLKASQSLAAERGVFPNYEKSIYAKKGLRMRNATVNTIAPTGTISIIAGCSSGIEPLFALSFVRNVLSGTELFEVNPYFEKMGKAKGFYSKELIAEITQSGSLQRIKGIPADVKRTVVTAFDVTPREHLLIQAAFQKFTDNSVSKTINLPADATVDDVRKTYLLAYQLKCKGITIYRYGSKKDQVLSFGYRKTEEHAEVSGPVSVDSEYSGGCAAGACPF
ncbi:MAG: ribonucleoside-diphosphate reductase, adenosylcobalamin-dependent [Deltaproteobacteria bacterium RBG_16_49_23]|nr:MAG: ribonucleoside-diphosphate reductase, adenosylcobalamin-dependent [Deltaproteobacteria bacterium RBG_16_49_23]